MSDGDTANGAGAGTDTRGITAADLYRFTFVSDPQLSPDGATVAFVQTTIDREDDAYRSRLWVVPADGSAPPRRFTGGPNDSAPRWSPDGRTLAFLAKRGGADEKAQVWLIGARGGEAWPLTDLAEGAADPRWSPDGSRIACTSKAPADAAAEPGAGGGHRTQDWETGLSFTAPSDRGVHHLSPEYPQSCGLCCAPRPGRTRIQTLGERPGYRSARRANRPCSPTPTSRCIIVAGSTGTSGTRLIWSTEDHESRRMR